VLQDLEYAMRTKGGLTPEEDNKLRILNSVPNAVFVLFSGLGSFVGWFAGLVSALGSSFPLLMIFDIVVC